MQMAMRDTKNLTLQEAVKCPVDIGFIVDAFVQNNLFTQYIALFKHSLYNTLNLSS